MLFASALNLISRLVWIDLNLIAADEDVTNAIGTYSFTNGVGEKF